MSRPRLALVPGEPAGVGPELCVRAAQREWDADLVVFMDKGKVVEQGGFAELSLRNGRFASLLRAGGLLNDEEVRRLSRTVTEAA